MTSTSHNNIIIINEVYPTRLCISKYEIKQEKENAGKFGHDDD